MNTEQRQRQIVLESMYSAVLNPASIGEILQSLVEYCEVEKAALQLENLKAQSVVRGGQYFGYHQSELDSYFTYFSKKEPWTPRIVDCYGTQFGFVCSDDILPLRDYQASEFYNDWAKQLDVGRSLTCSFHTKAQQSFKFCLKQSSSREFTSKQILKIRSLFPYLMHFADLLATCEQPGNSSSFLAQLVKLSDKPCFVVDQNCNLLNYNDKFEQIKRQCNQFTISGGRLELQNSRCQLLLRKAIHQMSIQQTPLSQQSNLQSRYVGFPEGNGYIHLLVIPALLAGTTKILAYLSIPQLTATKLQTYLGLSPREALLCVALSSGRTLKEASVTLCQSIHASRKQLKKIFVQLDVQNQAQLVDLVLSIHEWTN